MISYWQEDFAVLFQHLIIISLRANQLKSKQFISYGKLSEQFHPERVRYNRKDLLLLMVDVTGSVYGSQKVKVLSVLSFLSFFS